MPTATETDLNNRLLQTTSSKELLAIMREIREKQAANSEAPNKSRRHLPSVPKPCGIGYQTRPPLMKRFKDLISGSPGNIKRRRDCPGHVAEICTSASGQGNDEARTSTFSTGSRGGLNVKLKSWSMVQLHRARRRGKVGLRM